MFCAGPRIAVAVFMCESATAFIPANGSWRSRLETPPQPQPKYELQVQLPTSLDQFCRPVELLDFRVENPDPFGQLFLFAAQIGNIDVRDLFDFVAGKTK